MDAHANLKELKVEIILWNALPDRSYLQMNSYFNK